MNDLEINSENFNEFFSDVRMNKPKKGQVMACYRAMAEFVEGPEKQQMIDLLFLPEKAIPATQVMRKLLFASELDAIRVPRQIVEDLRSGLTVDTVLKKPYKYVLECFFFTQPEYVPEDDPHWSKIPLIYDEYLKAKEYESEESE